MNLQEYAALQDDNELCHEARLVYLVFRRYMDFATGVVGRQRVVDYNEIRQSLEYSPARGSRDSPKRYSRDQVKRYIQLLVDRGLLRRLHRSGLRESMVFLLPLASSDSVRLNEERHQSATRGAPPLKPVMTGVAVDSSATGAPREERHISDISDTLSHHISREAVFAMHLAWEPEDSQVVVDRVGVDGFSLHHLDDDQRSVIIDEFRRYWVARPDVRYTEYVWSSKLADSVVFHMRARA
ncbi:MAG: hypothetical protein OIF55_19245 [Amphritea sp.]|nr:hypothetical protein [Amphritea sp.]